ncbi:MAG: hypothetical protein R3C55_09445 [Parvularculaceae bacterium]
MAVGAGAGAAAAAAVAVGIALPHSDGPSFWDRLFRIQKTSSDICLKADMPLVAGMTRRCYAPAEFAAFMDSPVLGGDGAPVSVRLAHPTDMSREPDSVTTCNQYRARIAEGWYAETARDMAREGFFTRACGVVSMLAEAKAPEVTYFDDSLHGGRHRSVRCVGADRFHGRRRCGRCVRKRRARGRQRVGDFLG